MKTAGIVTLVLIIGLVVAGLVAQRMSDGPTGPIQGGPLIAGELVSGLVDWNVVLGEDWMGEIELQLVEPPGSRVTAAFVYEDQFYIPCDLGFIWRRLPDTSTRWLLHLIWLLKGWHEDALHDGRAVLRIDGKRYERQAVRVTDPELLPTLRTRVETPAAEFFGGLLPDEPDTEAIWFFRMDPRS